MNKTLKGSSRSLWQPVKTRTTDPECVLRENSLDGRSDWYYKFRALLKLL